LRGPHQRPQKMGSEFERCCAVGCSFDASGYNEANCCGKEISTSSKKSKTRELAETPTRFEVMTIPSAEFPVIPEVSSERREYVPIGWLKPPTIPSNLVHTVVDATLSDFALITCRMHMAWLRNIGGRLESRYRYSIGIVYNPFPWPQLDEPAKQSS